MLPKTPGRLRAHPSLPKLALCLAIAALAFWACQLTQGDGTNRTVSFPKLYDSLSKYDSVVIEVKDPSGPGSVDTVVNGPIRAASDLENLSAPHYQGGSALIVISGFRKGKIALRLEKRFDGTTGKTLATDSVVLSGISLIPDSAALHLKAGDTAALPKVIVKPEGLADKTLLWGTSDPAILTVSGARLEAKAAGTAKLIAKLKVDSAEEVRIDVFVAAKDSLPAARAPRAPAIASVLAGDAKVTLVWNAVPDADAYNLYYGEGGAVDKGSTRIKNVTNPYEVKGLKNGVDYGFSLSAVNAAGESDLGETKVATPQAPAPSAPGIDSAVVGNGNVTLYWKPVPGALAYVLYYKSGNAVDKSGIRVAGISSPYTLSGLANGTQYAFVLATLMSSAESGLGNVVTATPSAPPATALSYAANPAVYWQSVPIPANAASVSGSVDSFTVTPDLPRGLTLDKASGAITGTPTAASAKAVYTVTARNSGGVISVALTLTVNGPPSGLAYSENPASYWQTVAIATNSASVSGIVDSFTVSPALPAGLELSKTTGAISGTPSAIAAQAAYTVTAWNKAGSAKAMLLIGVKGPPSGFGYAVNPAAYWKGVAIAPNPAAIAGPVDSFTVAPALPAGLTLNKSTGEITGAATVAAAPAKYVVTAWNKSGTTTAELNLAVKGPPSGLAYATSPASYPKGAAIPPNAVSYSGAVDSFTVTPALPAGLSLDKAKGTITGTPSAAAAAADYAVTAYNPAGTATAKVNIAVFIPLSGLSYAVNPAVYWKSVPIAPNAATLAGTPDSFTVAPALPAGLVLDKATGRITGTPTVQAAAAVYVVTAKSSTSASVTANLTLTVNGPPTLNYAPATATWFKSAAIAPLSPATSGVIDSVTVTPALPPGLALNPSTGSLSGTPSAISHGTYVFTAWNKAGTAKDTLGITVSLPGTPLAIQKDLAADSSNTSSYNVGFTANAFMANWPIGPYQALLQFDLSGVSLAGFDSAKLVLRTYAYGPGWDGSPVTVKAHILRIKHPWTEGTGNWYWHDGAWQNNGAMLLSNYGIPDSIKAASTDPASASGATYLDKYLVRPDSLIPVSIQNVTITYPPASIHRNFTTPFPGPANLVDVELDLSEYVKAMAGNPNDYGFVICFENLPSADDHITMMTKEAGDGSYGARLYLYY
jgi:hypothetical protein